MEESVLFARARTWLRDGTPASIHLHFVRRRTLWLLNTRHFWIAMGAAG